MLRIEQERRIGQLQRQLMEWVKEHISSDSLKSPEKIAEALRIIAKDRKEQIEEVTALLGPGVQRGLRISTPDDRSRGDIWLSVWPDGSLGILASIHGYDESTGILHIIRGAVHEQIYKTLHPDEKSDGKMEVVKAPSFSTEGTTITIPPNYIHSLAGSEGDGMFSTLIGFLPALRRVEIFEEEQNGDHLSLRKVAVIKVDDKITSVDFSSVPSDLSNHD